MTTTESPAAATADATAGPAAEASTDGRWDARRLFTEIAALSPLRVISQTGPSVWESICELRSFGIHDGWLNAITPQYHWHLNLEGLRHVRSRDEVHERSGRRVLFLELWDDESAKPFLLLYLHRGKGEELGEEREARFQRLHERFRHGAPLLDPPGDGRTDDSPRKETP